MSPGAGSNAGRGRARGGQREAAKPKSAGAGKKRGKGGKSAEPEEFVPDHVVTTRLHRRIQRDFPDAEAARGIIGAVRKLAVELEFPGPSGERLAAAAVIVADRTVGGFRSAVRLANLDWRDLLMASGLGGDWEDVLDEVLGPR